MVDCVDSSSALGFDSFCSGFFSITIHCYWYLVAVNWGIRYAFSYSFLFEASNCLTLE